jgi:penicillin-binding protein 2
MTGDNGGMDGLPPLDSDNVGPSGSAPTGNSGNRSSMPPQPLGDGPNATPRKPVLRYVPGVPGMPSASGGPITSGAPAAPGAQGPRGAMPSPRPSYPGGPSSYPGGPSSLGGLDDRTQELPSGYFVRDMVGPRRQIRPPRAQRSQGWLVLVLSVLIVVGVIAALLVTPLRDLLRTSNVPLIGGCGDGSPCQVATAYLADYGSSDYESMYNLTSSASHTRFGAADTRGGYKDGHDYIVNRTKAIVGEAQITSIQTTVGGATSQSDTQATVTTHVVMTSARVGQIIEDLKISLVKENGKWLVDWTPGLIFTQLDDPSDPQYHRLVHLFATSASRGAILDRDGNALAKDDTVYDIDVDTSKITNEASLDATLATNLNMTSDQVKAAYKAGHPVRTISKDYYAKISGSLGSLPAVHAEQRTARVYPNGAATAAITGYVSVVTPDDLKNDGERYYCDLDDPNTCGRDDIAGHTGIEVWAEQYLRPAKGGTLAIVERNADGSLSNQPLITLGSRQPTSGADVHTTISLKDQQTAYGMLNLYQNYGGAAFAVVPSSGEVLVMASYPACDPNDFSLAFDPGVQACNSATDGRQLNRALTSAQPIGSAFKVVTLSAYLEHGGSLTQTYQCGGDYHVPGTSIVKHDTAHSASAYFTAVDAFGPSCDWTFWAISATVNAQGNTFLSDMAKSYGYGSATGIVGVPDGLESPGLVPDPDWLSKTQNGATWTAAEAVDLGIGQGAFLATPAQVAMVAAAVANNGVRMQPRLVTTVISADGTPIVSSAPKQVGKLPLLSQNLANVQNALLKPTSPGGTAYSSFKNFAMPVAGKTGTAEVPNPRPQSWFLSYAPTSPTSAASGTPIATAALVEHSSYGEQCAVPMTLQIMRTHFNQPGDPDPTLLNQCKQHFGFP